MAPYRRFVVALGAVALSGVARAHDVTATRFEAPIPLALLFGGAGATVALTALFLSVSGRTSDADPANTVADATGGAPGNAPTGRLVAVPSSAVASVRTLAGGGFLLAFAATLYAGLFGTQTPTENPAVVFVWALWLKGVVLLAVVVGDPWPTLSPWRTLYDGLARLEGEAVALAEYPDWLGEWPALVGFVATVGIVENLTWIPRSPRWTAVLLAGYAAAMVLGAVAFGREWLRRADFFAVLYRLFGRVAPLDWKTTGGDGIAISLRPPWRGCRTPVSLPVAAFVVAAVYTVSFDGFANTPEYQTLLFGVRDATGLGPIAAPILYLVGYVGFLVAFAAVAAVTNRVVAFDTERESGWRRGNDWRDAVRALAPTILPIAVAYEIAHNAAFVVTRFGDAVAILGGPDLVLLSWLSLPAFWAAQVALVVAGHVVAVVAAHGVVGRAAAAREAAEGEKRESGVGGRFAASASRAHAPLTALMVGYTVLSLWIISRPVVA